MKSNAILQAIMTIMVERFHETENEEVQQRIFTHIVNFAQLAKDLFNIDLSIPK